MSESLRRFTADHHEAIEQALRRHLPQGHHAGVVTLNEAVRRAVFPGGRRFRPTLTLLAARLVGGSVAKAMRAACAMEFLHCSSLVFDDLPAMDDADQRRGQPSLHTVFGEGVAVLAGLALLNGAYGLLADKRMTQSRCARLLREASACIGMNGMIGGQAIDLLPRSHGRSAAGKGGADLVSRNLKTTALLRLTLVSGAIASAGTEKDLAALERCGDAIGTAYQIMDDLLDDGDDDGEPPSTGKPAGQDARHGRRTALAEMSRVDARRAAMRSLDEARTAIFSRFGNGQEAMMLCDAAASIVDLGAAIDPAIVAHRSSQGLRA